MACLSIVLDWQPEPAFSELVRELESLLANAPELVRQGFFDRLHFNYFAVNLIGSSGFIKYFKTLDVHFIY